METIKVGRYSHPESHGWGGWVEPETREWILFIPQSPTFRLSDGKTITVRPQLHLGRDPITGAVSEHDDPEVGQPTPEPDYR